MNLPPLHSITPSAWRREESVLQRIRRLLLALSFWSAVTLPFLYIPLLAAGLETLTRILVFLGLLALNIVTLVISHSYRPNRG